MLGFDMNVVRGGQVKSDEGYPRVDGGETIYYYAPTSIGRLPIDPITLMQQHAVEVICRNGFPLLYTIRAGDFPHPLGIPDDELVHVESWDQG